MTGLRARLEALDEDRRGAVEAAMPVLPALARKLWTAAAMAAPAPIYDVAEAWDLTGPLDVDSLRRALDVLWARHRALRTVVVDVFAGPRVATLPAANGWPLEVVDLTAVPEVERALVVEEAVPAAARHPFDLGEGPLVLARLLRRAPQEHTLVLVLHHLVCDGESLRILGEELTELYRDPATALRPAADALVAQSALGAAATDERRRANESFWVQTLSGAPSEAPVRDHPRPAVRTHRGHRVPLPLRADWYDTVRSAAAALHCSSFDAALAALAVVWSRFTRREDVVVGTTMDMRSEVDAEGVVGFLVRALPLPVRVDEETSVGDLVRSARDTVHAAMSHDLLDLDDIVTALGRGGAPEPLVGIALELVHGGDELDLAGTRARTIETDPRLARTDLTVYLNDEPGRRCFVEYATELYDRTTAEGLALALTAVLHQLPDALDASVADLALLDEDGGHPDSGRGANADPAPILPSPVALPDRIREAADRHPRRPALSETSSGRVREIDYTGLVERADRWAAQAAKHGVGPGDRVGVCLRPGPDHITAQLGLWFLGAITVPLDPGSPPARLRTLLDASEPCAVLVDGDALPVGLPDGLRIGPPGDTVTTCGRPSRMAAGAGVLDRVAYVIHTSGTSGTPKPVQVRHRALASFTRAMHGAVYGTIAAPARVAVNAPPTFDASLQGIGLLAAGHTLHIVPEDVRVDPVAMVAWLDTQRIDILDATPTHVGALVDAGLLDSGQLALLVMGGEAVPPVLWERLRAARLATVNVYGPTECTVNVSAAPLHASGPRPILGHPLDEVGIELLDHRLRAVPRGFPGEVHVRGPQLADGYLGQGARTADRFLPAPGGARRYATGDVGRRRVDGRLEFLGRADDQIKLFGHRIEPAEVVAALCATPGVRDAAVAVLGAPPVLTAFLRVDEAQPVSDVRAHLRQRLPATLVPGAVRVVPAFPRTRTGKIDLRALAEAHDLQREHVGHGPESLVRPGEIAVDDVDDALVAGVCRIVERLLGRDCVDPAADFFAVGGNSLLATTLAREVDVATGIRLPLHEIFRRRTPAALAATVRAARDNGSDATPRRGDDVVVVDDGGLAVPLRVGGNGPTLVVAHPLGGSLAAYEPLIELLPTAVEVWGLRSPTAAGEGPEPDGVDDLVRRYVEALLPHLRTSRLVLFGWSLGGLIALALTAELEARGLEVAFTEMWDCGLRTTNPLTERELVAMALRETLGADAAAAMGTDLLPDHALRATAHGTMSAAAAAAGTTGRMEDFHRTLSVVRAQSALFRTWMPPRRVTAALHVVHATESLRTDRIGRSDWSRVTQGGWDAVEVEADHYSLVRMPAVARAARGLRRRLRRESVATVERLAGAAEW